MPPPARRRDAPSVMRGYPVAMDMFDGTSNAMDGIRVGIGGWTYAPWRDNFYPKGLVQRRELEYASRHVTSIEINGTYYGTQKPATYAKWRDEAPDGFVFSAKAPMRIMQSRSLAKTGPQVEDFVYGIAELGDKLGPLVWQFDAGLKLEREAFSAFCELLPREADGRALRHVLDVRDAAFVDADYLALARLQDAVVLPFLGPAGQPFRLPARQIGAHRELGLGHVEGRFPVHGAGGYYQKPQQGPDSARSRLRR